MFGQYGNFMNDPTAQIAASMGQNAFKHGQEYFEQNVGCAAPRKDKSALTDMLAR